MHDDDLLGDAWRWEAETDALPDDGELEQLLERILVD